MKKHLQGNSSPKDGTIDRKNTVTKGTETAKISQRESVAKITERVLKEHRPALDWLAGK
ncbi:MAG: hypothetical protein V4550_14845 [Gemmatimonadota bacterium]